MICPQFYDAMCFYCDLTSSDGIQKMISSWLWVSCGGHNHHLAWHWPLVVQEKQSHDLLRSRKRDVYWRALKRLLIRMTVKCRFQWLLQSKKRHHWTGMDFQIRCHTHHFLFSRFYVKLARHKAKLTFDIVIWREIFFCPFMLFLSLFGETFL